MKNEILGIDCSRYPLHTRVTGVELYTKEIIDHLLKLNLPLRIRLYTRTPLPLSGPNIEQTVIRRQHLWTRFGLSRELKKRPISRLFIPSHTLPNYAPTKSFVTIHGLEASHFPAAYSTFQHFHQRWSTKHAIQKAHRLIAVSQSVANDLENFYHCPPSKISVIHHGFSASAHTPDNPQEFAEFAPYILSVGRLEQRKNQTRLLQAFARFHHRFPRYRLLLAGPPGHGAQEINELIEELHLADSVIKLGFVPHEKIKNLLAGSTIFAYPSLAEGFGFPVLEAFAANTPVLTSATTCLPEVAGDAALLIDPLSIDKIYQGLLTLTTNDTLRQKLIRKGQTRLADFSWQACAEETAEILLA